MSIKFTFKLFQPYFREGAEQLPLHPGSDFKFYPINDYRLKEIPLTGRNLVAKTNTCWRDGFLACLVHKDNGPNFEIWIVPKALTFPQFIRIAAHIAHQQDEIPYRSLPFDIKFNFAEGNIKKIEITQIHDNPFPKVLANSNKVEKLKQDFFAALKPDENDKKPAFASDEYILFLEMYSQSVAKSVKEALKL